MHWERKPQKWGCRCRLEQVSHSEYIFFILSLVLKFFIVNNHLGALSLPCNDFIFCPEGSHLIFKHSSESNDLE